MELNGMRSDDQLVKGYRTIPNSRYFEMVMFYGL